MRQRVEHLKQELKDIIDSREDRASVATVLAKLKNPGQFMEQFEYLMGYSTEKSQEVLELKDGHYFDRSSYPIVDKEKIISGGNWFSQDITESKKMEAGLQQNQHQEDRVYWRIRELGKVKEKVEG